MTLRVAMRIEADGASARAELQGTARAVDEFGRAATAAGRSARDAGAGTTALGAAAVAASAHVRGFAAQVDSAAQALNRDFGGAFGSAAASASAFEVAIDGVGAEFAQLEGQMLPAIRATRELEAVQAQAARAVQLGAVSQQRAAAVIAAATARHDQAVRAAAGGSRNFGAAAQQAGFQIGDFAVQVQGGVNPLVAFSQQASQLLGVFGVWGAVAGAAIAIGSGLASAFIDLGEDAEVAADKSEALNTAIANLRDAAVTNADGIAQLIANYGALDAKLIGTIKLAQQANLLLAQTAAEAALRDVGDQAVEAIPELGRRTFQTRGGAIERSTDYADLADQLGITADQAVIVRREVNALNEALNETDRAAALGNLSEVLSGTIGPRASRELVELADRTTDAQFALRALEEQRRRVAESEELLSRPVGELNRLGAAATAPRGRSQGGGRSERADRPDRAARVEDEIAAEIAALERLATARGQSAEAEREALVVEAQVQALRRAGLDLADLAGGAEQARAARIATLTAELYAQRDAQETAAEVTREYADIAGASYADATAEIERWRDAALASLDAVGQGHGALADQVDAIARERLREAYADDLDARTDWRAGVERGLNDILESHGTLADGVENVLVTAFQSAEDAFVDLATTGKIQTQDLVEFALRQLYRLAEASAISFATGGDGGVLGQLFGGLVSLAGGALGGGGIVGPSGSGVLGGSGMFASAHTGGMVADAALTHRLDPSVFRGAPRLHEGGLLPGERPAILLEDERVLTAAQQAATAQTISGLARMVQGQASAQATGMALQVNVIGAPSQPRVTQGQSADGPSIDIVFEEVEGRLATNMATGRGRLHTATAARFGLRPRGAV